ncbi:hypothetical protein HZS_1891 [Henneguya salminicola]|nr:hypothetical protein HZS_1891 [Henneguya salminicola]
MKSDKGFFRLGRLPSRLASARATGQLTINKIIGDVSMSAVEHVLSLNLIFSYVQHYGLRINQKKYVRSSEKKLVTANKSSQKAGYLFNTR